MSRGRTCKGRDVPLIRWRDAKVFATSGPGQGAHVRRNESRPDVIAEALWDISRATIIFLQDSAGLPLHLTSYRYFTRAANERRRERSLQTAR